MLHPPAVDAITVPWASTGCDELAQKYAHCYKSVGQLLGETASAARHVIETQAKFGVLLRERRMATGLTQASLAELAGVSTRTVQDLERGLSQPHRDTLNRIMQALALTPEDRSELQAAARPHPRNRRRTHHAISPTGSPAGSVHNLPVPMTSFVDRSREMGELRELVRTSPIVTLIGPRGVGKTRLAIQVARTTLHEYFDSVYFVPVAEVAMEQVSPLALAIAQEVGVADLSGPDLPGRLADFLRPRRALIVLDAFDDVRHDISILRSLAADCEAVRLLVTTRVLPTLGAGAVQEYEVRPLEYPPDSPFVSARVATASPAVQLFLERARAARNDFALSEPEITAITEICRRVDGLPLAIELAAARARILRPTQILERDEPRAELNSMIESNLQMLGADERDLFARLAVFSRGFTLQAAEEVCAPHMLSQPLIDVLGNLAGWSLLQRPLMGDGVSPRFTMLEIIREHAFHQLRASGEAQALQRRHAEYFLDLVTTAGARLTGRAQIRALEQLKAERDNIRAALRWAAGGGPSELEIGLKIASDLWRFWQVDGRAGEGLYWIEEALSRAGGIDDSLRATALIAAGELACVVGNLATAHELSERSLALCRGLNDVSGTAQSLHVLAWCIASRAHTESEFERAAALQRESLELSSQLDDGVGAARGLHHLGDIARQLGWYDPAQYSIADSYLLEARRLRTNQGDWQGVAWDAHCLALLDLDRGQLPMAALLAVDPASVPELNRTHLRSALDWANEALTIWRSIEHGPGTSATLSTRARIRWQLSLLGGMPTRLSDLAAAVSDIDESLALWSQLRIAEWLVNDLQALASLLTMADCGDALRISSATLLGAAEALDSTPPPAHHERERTQLWRLLRTHAGIDPSELTRAQMTGRMQGDNAQALALEVIHQFNELLLARESARSS
jgi:predicted ATPase/transcriptional regulator with XRE-family HTH domain